MVVDVQSKRKGRRARFYEVHEEAPEQFVVVTWLEQPNDMLGMQVSKPMPALHHAVAAIRSRERADGYHGRLAIVEADEGMYIIGEPMESVAQGGSDEVA